MVIGMISMSLVRNVEGASNEIVLIGASITEAWHVDGLSARTADTGFRVTPLVLYEFDKSSLVNSVLERPAKPRAVIIKECGAYFPGDQSTYESLVKVWVQQLREAGIQPVLATALPVTRSQPTWTYAKQLIKRYILFRDDYVDNGERLEGIWRYNDWVRRYASQEQLLLLDLEGAITESTGARFLPDEFDAGDGLHLNQQAYARLDKALTDLLLGLSPAS